jgi:hypothetical protein
VENSSDDKDGLQSTSEKSISVLLADSSPMQLQLLTASLRRRPEFKVVSCPLDADILHQAIKTSSPEILVFAPTPITKRRKIWRFYGACELPIQPLSRFFWSNLRSATSP